MLGVIHNEQIIVDKVLKDKTLIVSMSNTIDILIKYYYLQNKNIDELDLLYNILNNLKECNIDNFSPSKCEETIATRMGRFYKTIRKFGDENVKLNVVDKIVITKAEVAFINSYEDKKIQNILFIMLVYAKITNKLNNNESYWINQSLTNITKEAKLTSPKRKTEVFHGLYLDQAISAGNKVGKVSIKVNYAYEDSEEEIVITDFDGCVHYWLQYKGEKWKRCEGCGKWVKVNSKTFPQKYCKECRKKYHNENTLKSYHKNKEK